LVFGKRAVALLMIFSMLATGLNAQTNANPAAEEEPEFSMKNFPQWVQDMRRWEIIAFGTFPFAMFFSTMGMDLYRWQMANGMDMSNDGRRYAPWPLKAAGAIAMTDDEQAATISIAIGLSATVAIIDHLIERAKRQKERRRAESLPSGTVIINRTPPNAEQPEGDASATDGDSSQANP